MSDININNWDAAEVRPAADTWQGSCPETLTERLAFFETNGFLVLPAVLSKTEVAELDRQVAYMAEHHESLPKVREGFNVEDPSKWPDPETPVFRKIGGFCDFNEAFAALCAHPTVMEIVSARLGPVVQLYRDVIMMKQAKVGREKPWHQDAVYWPYEPNDFVSAMTALDAADPDNGCLQVVPGSHHLGALDHHGKELQVTLSEEQQAETLYVPLQPGDTLIFHSLLLHGSEPNHSDRHRRVCILSYMSPDFTWTGEGERPKVPTIYDARES